MLHKFINSLLIPKYVIVDGHKIFIDKDDSLNLAVGSNYKPMESKVLEEEVKTNNTVLDIGANIGDDTLLLAKIVGSKGKIYAFEPDPENFKLLQKNIKTNKYRNVVCINKAVSDKDGKIKLFLSENNKADHRIYGSEFDRKHIKVNMVSIDSYFKNKNQKIDVIKIDIQGAEMLAFEGMKNTLRRNKYPKILCEFWPIGLRRCGSSAGLYLKFLRKLGYTIYFIDESGGKIIKVSDKYLKNKFTIKNEKFANLVCKMKQ
jgi:FkbM family methyltransferase